MNKTLREQLEEVFKKPKDDPFFKGYEPKSFFNHVDEPIKKPQKRRREHLTESDIKYLMGVDRPIYRKYKGSFRQR